MKAKKGEKLVKIDFDNGFITYIVTKCKTIDRLISVVNRKFNVNYTIADVVSADVIIEEYAYLYLIFKKK